MVMIHGGTQMVVPSASGDKDGLFYYRPAAAPASSIQTIPDGLKMVVGNAHATSESTNLGIAAGKIRWKCGPGSGTYFTHPPAQCGSGVMVLTVTFPQFWDGVHLDSPDHLSHMTYTRDAAHPVALPRIQAFIRYTVGTAPIGTVVLGSGPYYTVHADFFDAWDPSSLQSLVTRCINAGVDCGKNPAV
jgi:hypothetical protein